MAKKVKRIKPKIIFKIKLIIASFMLIVLVSFISDTFSKYISSSQGDLTLSFAKWQILVNDYDITEEANSEILFVPVITYNENVNENAIAPSTEGYFDIKIDPSNIGLSFKYNIDFKIENEDIPDLMITKYAILPETFNEDDDNIDYIPLESNELSDELIYNPKSKFEPFTIRLHFEWIDGDGEQMIDEYDALIGSVAALENSKFKMKANIKFEQILG